MTAARVTLFLLDLEADGAGGAADIMLLDEHEKLRARRFQFARDRTRFVAAHAGLRRCLASVVHAPPAALRLVTNAHVKPTFADAAGWHFNLSHSGPLGLVGLSDVAPLGVDIECLREVPDMFDVARQVFTDDERAALRALAPEHRIAGFLRAWTRKEAVIKATGEGFSADLKSFSVTLGRAAAARFQAPPPAPAGTRWALADVEVGPRAVAAVAMAVPGGGDLEVVTAA